MAPPPEGSDGAGAFGRAFAPPDPERILTGGVVAYNEEPHIAGALDSLLGQRLPPGWGWGDVWVVASGCTDRTVEIAEAVAARDPRVRVVVEPERGGKARALGEVLRRARGDALVLLNSDARAASDSVAALLRTAEPHSAPYAVMGHPLPAADRDGRWAPMVRLMWDLHDEFHREVLADEEGTHLSDELLLLSLPLAPKIPAGIINDGSYIGAWLTQREGSKLYAPSAVVETDPPRSLRDHLTQRRRILTGHQQVARLLRVTPSALPRFALAHPRRAVEVVRRAMRQGHHRVRDLLYLCAGELVAAALAGWDRLPPRRDHSRWQRISAAAPPPERPVLPTGGSTPRALIDLRVAALLRVAGRFGAGIPLDELTTLLPSDGPAEELELRQWLDARPGLAQVTGDRAFAPDRPLAGLAERAARALEYRRAAEELVERQLGPVLRWVRCVGITGSAAYGTPEEGDDLDLFVVTRTGALWVFLAYTYLALRWRGRANAARAPAPCFNYVLEDPQARQEFREARGFLFAREALTTRICQGESYYRGLLATAPWLGAEIPRLYARRSGASPPTREPPAEWPIRLASACLFPVLATYLQLVGLHRNARYRAHLVPENQFRTQTGPRRLAFVSRRFDRLRADLAPAAIDRRAELPVGGTSRVSGAR